jgi:superfamily I DNA/RNA helicase
MICFIQRVMFSPDTSRFANHSRRFQHVVVDEFQDTDPLQIEILWRLCGEAQKDGGRRSLRANATLLGHCISLGTPNKRSIGSKALTSPALGSLFPL